MEPLNDSISARSRERPNAVAVALGLQRVTYGELEGRSNQIARALTRSGVKRGDRVCLVMRKSPRAIETIVAVLKAGAVFVPLDPESPTDRLQSMIQTCDTAWIMATHACASEIERLFGDSEFAHGHVVGWLDAGHGASVPNAFDWASVEAESTDPVKTGGSLVDPAYMLFTSGSTGVPKGVVITHSNVTSFLSWALRYFDFSPNDRISGHPPLHFDLSIFDIFGALTSGAELHLVPPEFNLLPARVVQLIADRGLTQWFSVPGVLTLIAKFDLLRDKALPTLRRVLWCGEALPTVTLRYWMSHVPHARFTNLYGPTEATIASSYYTVPKLPESDDDVIPIGTACTGEELLVLDEARNPAAPGEIGDLYIAGAGLSPGYWRDAEKTARAYLPDPRSGHASQRIYKTGDLARVGPEGLVYFHGRADTQIKSRGYRIELGEIESALNAGSDLKECAVVSVATAGFDGAAICCAYVPASSATTPASIRHRLTKRLPSYMLPSRWKEFEALPRNANGKVDRRLLQESFQGNS